MFDIGIKPEFRRFGFILVENVQNFFLSSLNNQILHVKTWTQTNKM